jgi:isocitrate/isopropylmalate dehydrogenase
VIREGKFRTGDLGGKATTSDFTQAICDAVVKAQASN